MNVRSTFRLGRSSWNDRIADMIITAAPRSTTFFEGILLQVVLNGGVGYWPSNRTSQ